MTRNYRAHTLPSELCHHLLQTHRWGIEAKTVTTPHTPGVLYTLPLFYPGTNIALTWDQPLVGVITQPTTAHWAFTDRTAGTKNGALTLTPADNTQAGDLTAPTTRHHTAAALRRELSTLTERGEQAKWELAERFHTIIYRSARLAATRVSEEISNGKHSYPAVDEIEIDTIVATYILGRDGQPDSLFFRHLTKASSSLRAGVGDRYTYLCRNIDSAIESAVRRTIQEPLRARAIRLIHRKLGEKSTPDNIRDVFRTEYEGLSAPSNQVILNALTTGPTAGAQDGGALSISALSGKELLRCTHI